MQDYLKDLAKDMPHKTIEINGEPYLRRYYAGTWGDVDYWLHEFLRSDGERHLHNHPFKMRCAVLTGGYDEELLDVGGVVPRRPEPMPDKLRQRFVGEVLRCEGGDSWMRSHVDALGARPVDPFTWHRITSVLPGTWTLCAVEAPRLPHWYFLGDDGQLEQVEASPRHWWRSC